MPAILYVRTVVKQLHRVMCENMSREEMGRGGER